MKKTCLLALVMLVSATGASAANADADAAKDQAGKADKPAKEKVICRTENATGSRTNIRRICHTREEWDEIAARTSRDLNSLVRDQNGAQPQVNPMTGQR